MAKNLSNILESAKFLMSEEGQKQINHAVKQNSFNNDGDFDTHIPSNYQGAGRILNESKNQNFSSSKAEKMGLPKSIVEAMAEDYSEGGVLSNMGRTLTEGVTSNSVLDDFVPTTVSAPKPQINEVRNESPRYNPQPIPQGNNGVDYTIIKAIVEECVKRNMEEIKQSILAESTLRTVKLANGNKIQLVDNKGNLYESTLTFKKNISKK